MHGVVRRFIFRWVFSEECQRRFAFLAGHVAVVEAFQLGEGRDERGPGVGFAATRVPSTRKNRVDAGIEPRTSASPKSVGFSPMSRNMSVVSVETPGRDASLFSWSARNRSEGSASPRTPSVVTRRLRCR